MAIDTHYLIKKFRLLNYIRRNIFIIFKWMELYPFRVLGNKSDMSYLKYIKFGIMLFFNQ